MIESIDEAFVPPPPPERKKRRFVPTTRKGKILLALTGLSLLWLLGLVPPPLWYRWMDPRETAFMAMRRHEDPAAAAGRKYQPVPFEEMPSNLRRAVLIAEDNAFYEHGGLDPVQIRMAIGYPRMTFEWSNPRDRADLWKAIRTLWSRRASVRGASTITQQLAKNLYLSPSRNPLRKIKELVTTWRLEIALPKDRILELYLNSAEMGNEIWGVEAASQAYFGKSVRRLSDREAATLAGLLPFPRTSNPLRRPGRMAWRRDYILRRMHGQGVALPVVPVPDVDSVRDSVTTPPPDSGGGGRP